VQFLIINCKLRNILDFFTYAGELISYNVSNNAWLNALDKAGLDDFSFHDLRHNWASWHRQARISCDELKELVGRKTRSMINRYAKFATEHLSKAANRLDHFGKDNVMGMSPSGNKKGLVKTKPLI
jgi:integrase